jgi:hypothetical protein
MELLGVRPGGPPPPFQETNSEGDKSGATRSQRPDRYWNQFAVRRARATAWLKPINPVSRHQVAFFTATTSPYCFF